jgi:uncharacterized membrane protein
VATLSVWKFDTAGGAEQAEDRLKSLAKQGLLTIQDAATVSWPSDKKRPKTQEMHNLAGAGALGGGFWGLLFGLIFFVPFLGLAVGAAAGALMGSLGDVGIDDKFIKSVRDQVKPGTSALFIMTSDVVLDKVLDATKDLNMELIQTNLSVEQENKLREAFADS